jgi:hypothetical protein
MPETIYVRGEGGGIHPMDLPLPESIADRLAKGSLRRVNEDGSPYVEADDSAASAPGPPTERPAQSAPKAAWVGWAVTNGADPDEAEALTKTDLIDLYGGQG